MWGIDKKAPAGLQSDAGTAPGRYRHLDEEQDREQAEARIQLDDSQPT